VFGRGEPVIGRRPFSGLRLQHRGEPGSTGPRSGDFSACSVTQPYAVKTVTVMGNVLDCLQVHNRVPSDLDKRITA
jgi:hypothetical protein